MMKDQLDLKTDYLRELLNAYYPLHFFALFRSHELYNVEPFIQMLSSPILDLGCGDGLIAKLLFDFPLDYGIDVSISSVRMAQKSGAYKNVFYGDAHSLPFGDGYLGGVFSNCVLEHIPAMPALLKEVSRVLKSGGYFVATCLTPFYYTMNPVFTLFDQPGLRRIREMMIAAENRLHNHVSVFNIEEYREMLQENDLIVEDHKYYAMSSVSNICNAWDTASKYLIPFPVGLRHSGLLIKYLKVRYCGFANKAAQIAAWYQQFGDICYDRNDAGQCGVGQIIVARKM